MAKSKNLIDSCPMDITINILSGKWKLSILWHLSQNIVRFNELQRLLPNITQKTLTMQLRELEKSGIIYRKIYAEVPPRVEYGLTQVGESLNPILSSMCEWGKDYKKIMK
ncbi:MULTISPECIES: winged helix-turn-helix transcriptional regulator [Clostridium]|uniref:winged helix-turn-helix transcriptional regulator n=1 Tax=Clostridium TaxID=1485 RepID=UPI00069DE4A9|nr:MULTISPECIES: helix-turn-helix domain-containing protein [Clostridium]KOF56529.1 HxlR family transcriptional regulator [Clostridium sp. DMHC 10]MCD2348859.1 helix-turn-helix transcriptional regulator [Clostridium guangxiense]